jgi:hypothetical protein
MQSASDRHGGGAAGSRIGKTELGPARPTPAVLVIVVRRPTGRCHSERGKFVNAVNGRTKGEKSEGLLILLTNSSDFDSAIRRFDPSRPSHPFMRSAGLPKAALASALPLCL